MFNGVVTAAFQDVHERHEIAVNVSMWIRQRITHSCLRREVDDSLRSNVPEQFSRSRSIRQLQLLEVESWPLKQLGQTILLQGWIVVVVQIIHTEDFVSLIQKSRCHMETDEASRTSY